MRWMWTLLVLATVGCGTSEGTFKTEFASSYCDAYMSCSDPALLTFDGILSKDDCQDRFSYAVFSWGSGCRYKGGKAKQCEEAMATLTCPAEGTEVYEALPAVCSEVFIDCAPFDALATDEEADTTTGDDTGEAGGEEGGDTGE